MSTVLLRRIGNKHVQRPAISCLFGILTETGQAGTENNRAPLFIDCKINADHITRSLAVMPLVAQPSDYRVSLAPVSCPRGGGIWKTSASSTNLHGA
ncbi:hypothetical protein CEXT_81911 [Caerostris extrusa]|uniref:Uncharacterized protein n=1 Tax=Caerostris extrusa TaxID=172846 RepID=A0AAV4NPQ3_CAEEX|nr:hypothetical protein CEXT_81911 [Caerostris extrusa]